jgi:hypothetical protein
MDIGERMWTGLSWFRTGTNMFLQKGNAVLSGTLKNAWKF